MKKKEIYAVFGLGRYGRAVAKELIKSGVEVLAVDMDEKKVNAAIADIPYCKCGNVTDIEVLKQLGIHNIDIVIIAMASNLEASVMATMLCKELGVDMVIVKCASEMNCKILTKVGADKVVYPEKESGIRLAKNLLSSGFVDMIELSKDASMVEIDVRPEWVGKNLIELNLRAKYSINVVAIIKNKKIDTYVDPALPLDKDMTLVIIANINKLNKLKANETNKLS
ncbi:MAG: TrkA family potassium uptake protein [Lachnospiraceae bacterium]|nr:TrkA family potassium uptake protein [Lachnospiraceae bacterium]